MPTVIPGSNFWVSQCDRYLLPRELMACQGFPVDDMLLEEANIGPTNVKSLAGNAMSTSVVGACILLILCNVDFIE